MNTAAKIENQLVLKQETARVNLLYKQNLSGVFAQLMYSVPYVYVSWHVVSHVLLLSWFVAFFLVGLARTAAYFLWKRKIPTELTIIQIKNRLLALEGLLLTTGLLWAPIAWSFPQATSAQQMVIAMSTIFMCAGCVCLYAGSLPATYAIVWPAFFPWIIALFLSPNPTHHLIGIVALLYAISGFSVAIILSRFTVTSLKLNLENADAKEALQESKENLAMALASSAAATWSWNIETKMLTCEGDFTAFGLQSRILRGTESEYLKYLDPSVRDSVPSTLLMAQASNGEIDMEHQLQIPGRGTMYIAIRGRAHNDEHGEIVGFKGICWDATGKRSEEVLRHERDVQEAANKAKSVFLANASHEMRTPLAAISGYTEALLDSSLPAQIREDLQVVQRTGRYLTSLVNDFLDLSRIETGQLYIQKNIISLEKEIAEVLQIIKPTFDIKNLKLILEITTNLPERIETDQTRLRQILINLLSNAAKYSEKGEVRVRVTYEQKARGKGLLSIRVIDTGVGITELVRHNLFRPFARGETAFIKRTEGAGLGLALSRSLARALGGDLRLVHSSPDVGSEFEFTLQLETLPTSVLKMVGSLNSGESLSSAPVDERPLDDMHILVAEDSEDLRELMERVLQAKGAIVDSCGDGAQAVDRAMKRSYDVVLMDINMPIMDGYQATAALRAKGYAMPVIALTAHASIEHRQMSLEAGCDAYLSKPINASSLVEVLKKCVQASRVEKHQIARRLKDAKAAPAATDAIS